MSPILQTPSIPSGPTSLGPASPRRDGREKTMGVADYTADHRLEGMLFGVFATAPVAHGRVVSLHTDAAERSEAVLHVITARNAPKLLAVEPPAGQVYIPLQDDRVLYEGQPLAMILAENLESALHGATLVRATIEPKPHCIEIPDALDTIVKLEQGYDEPDTATGDVAAGLASADARVEARYTIGHRHHNPLEPSATLAHWHGDDRITIYETTQHVWGTRTVVAAAFGLPPDHVRVISHYLGGGFGCKGFVWPHTLLTVMAARIARRPVKLVLTRAQTYTSHGFQGATRHDVRLGATRDGRLSAVEHHVVYTNATHDSFSEYAAAGTRSAYACPAIVTTHRAVKLNTVQPTAMRAPNEGIGNFAFESALDELGEQLALDPLELRLRNYATVDPLDGKPFSSKKLREAYDLGAKRFGWTKRKPGTRQMRDGDEWVGWGMATALMTTYRLPSKARLRMGPDGAAVIETGIQEIGTGTRTIMPMIAADVLGIDPLQVTIELGDTLLPEGGPTYGSSTTMGVGSAVADAAAKLRTKLHELGATSPAQYAAAVRAQGGDVVANGSYEPANDQFAMFGFGGVFAEVGVDALLGLVRVRRVVGAYSAGRIINALTATSQMTGGMIWGIGQALLEHSKTDRALGRFLSKNLSGTLVPVNADILKLEAYFIEEHDPHASPIGARGIGELGATGVAAAIVNAIYHAVGVRIRDLPAGPEQLLPAL